MTTFFKEEYTMLNIGTGLFCIDFSSENVHSHINDLEEWDKFEVCTRTQRNNLRLKAAIPKVDRPNQIVTMDLKEYDAVDSEKRFIYYLIDMCSILMVGKFI